MYIETTKQIPVIQTLEFKFKLNIHQYIYYELNFKNLKFFSTF